MTGVFLDYSNGLMKRLDIADEELALLDTGCVPLWLVWQFLDHGVNQAIWCRHGALYIVSAEKQTFNDAFIQYKLKTSSNCITMACTDEEVESLKDGIMPKNIMDVKKSLGATSIKVAFKVQQDIV